ncbi:DUF805 domain-containing protein [Proteus cibarius]|uniref:DUF805 domain-containing protein n=1 Tax=Proteus terrae subsp. cibarius TaxID=626774 RepID=A0A6I6FQQ1_9GAMM|nr:MULTISPECIES: DUF805 domain-containing protein [Proteus]QHP76655.1 DUF805 domain-containing protein [Proteus vulgaris]MBG2913418.1 DUF805 domain-containing protein [Proteus terrae subsp. cibarius]MBG3090229.1 DUF805 domain-containing protein [Proteus terrae subsp. cibarius]MBG6037272.1 DUF805 domain-containing protein [Proteus terrae subsp. cibarius]MCM2366355.1 DUF805 domain-containing protein [Proteus sp. FZP2095]
MNWYLEVIKNNYANFSGRARRKEYWMFTLVNTIIITILYAIVISSIDMNTGEMSSLGSIVGIILGIYSLAIIIPSLAVTIRRFHDQDKSGWMFLLAFIPAVGGLIVFVFMCLEGTKGDNRFGPDPKA